MGPKVPWVSKPFSRGLSSFPSWLQHPGLLCRRGRAPWYSTSQIACNDWSLVTIFHVSSFGGGSSYRIVVRVAEKSGNCSIVLVQYSTMRESICCRTAGSGGAVAGMSAGGRARKADLSATATSAARDLSPGQAALPRRQPRAAHPLGQLDSEELLGNLVVLAAVGRLQHLLQLRHRDASRLRGVILIGPVRRSSPQ